MTQPHTFQDDSGRTWRIQFDPATVRRLREELGLTPRQLYVSAMRGRVVDAGSLVAALVGEQCADAGVGPEDLAAALCTDRVAEEAGRAVVAALDDYLRDRVAAGPQN